MSYLPDKPRANAKLTIGSTRSKCPTCGEVFSTEKNFDRHRKGVHGVDRHCVDPETVGLTLHKLKSGYIWKLAEKLDVADVE